MIQLLVVGYVAVAGSALLSVGPVISGPFLVRQRVLAGAGCWKDRLYWAVRMDHLCLARKWKWNSTATANQRCESNVPSIDYPRKYQSTLLQL